MFIISPMLDDGSFNRTTTIVVWSAAFTISYLFGKGKLILGKSFVYVALTVMRSDYTCKSGHRVQLKETVASIHEQSNGDRFASSSINKELGSSNHVT